MEYNLIKSEMKWYEMMILLLLMLATLCTEEHTSCVPSTW